MRFSFLKVLKSAAPAIVLLLALPLVGQRAEVSEQQDPAQLSSVPANRVEGYFALAGFALVTVLCRKR
jgi:hypothetical protein